MRKDVKKLATCGAVVFIFGFGIWNLDNALCGLLTETKRALGMPWSFVLELHGWWHIFTGAGAYICLFSLPAILQRELPPYRALRLMVYRYCSR